MNCLHWKKCGVSGGGCCDLNLFGGRPSEGVCRNKCTHPDRGQMPYQIPEDFDPEQEKRRMQQGGCCGHSNQ